MLLRIAKVHKKLFLIPVDEDDKTEGMRRKSNPTVKGKRPRYLFHRYVRV